MIFNLSETNISGGSAQNVTLTIIDNGGITQKVYIPSNATWTGFASDMETREIKGVLTIPQNSMFTILTLSGTVTISGITSEKIDVQGQRMQNYVFECYVGNSDGTIEISI